MDERQYEYVSQARRIFNAFGGQAPLYRALRSVGAKVTYNRIIAWDRARDKNGTGGRVPSSKMPEIIKAARYAGITLSAEILDPRPSVLQIAKDGKRMKR